MWFFVCVCVCVLPEEQWQAELLRPGKKKKERKEKTGL